LGYWTTRDELTPLSGSLDPVSVANNLRTIEQIHFTGGKDHVVGTDVVASFLRHLPPNSPARLVEIRDFTHDCCWVRDWPTIAKNDLGDYP